jgi:hypothetical protein
MMYVDDPIGALPENTPVGSIFLAAEVEEAFDVAAFSHPVTIMMPTNSAKAKPMFLYIIKFIDSPAY